MYMHRQHWTLRRACSSAHKLRNKESECGRRKWQETQQEGPSLCRVGHQGSDGGGGGGNIHKHIIIYIIRLLFTTMSYG